MLAYADLDAISAEGSKDTPFKIQMQIAEVCVCVCILMCACVCMSVGGGL